MSEAESRLVGWSSAFCLMINFEEVVAGVCLNFFCLCKFNKGEKENET